MFEKPFGHDLKSAKELNDSITKVFDEKQIYRIDHYMAKELVQNLLVLRFANSIFEPLWNKEYIDHVQITVAETLGVEGRGDYYDQFGALRDVMQNHMMQLLALVAMAVPKTLAPDDVIPWHCHREAADHYFILQGELTISTRRPEGAQTVGLGSNYRIAPGRPHLIANRSAADCQFLLLQGIGMFDWVKVDD